MWKRFKKEVTEAGESFEGDLQMQQRALGWILLELSITHKDSELVMELIKMATKNDSFVYKYSLQADN